MASPLYKVNNTVEQLRSERDRFVAFAFASADILLELDPEGKIAFADGATSGLLGVRADDLIGKTFSDILHADDAQSSKLLQDVEHSIRVDDAKVLLKSRFNDALPFALSGFKLPYLNHHVYLTLSLLRADLPPGEMNKRDINSGLLKKENFADAANRKIREAAKDGTPVKVTLLDFPELKAFLDSLPVDAARQLMDEISHYIRSKSVDGDTAGMLGENSYSFVHDASISTDQITHEIIAITKKADPSGKGIHMQAETLETDPGKLNEQDSAAALMYTLNKFALEKGEKFSIHSLAEGYQSMLDETVEKIANFKETVTSKNFQIAFQPIVDLKTGVIHHFETLVRFENQEKFSNPFQFITFGEQAGLIGEFDLAMCQRTIDVLHEAANKGNKPLVSVNLSGKSLSSTLFMDTLYTMMKRNERVSKQVIFEVTESSKISDLAGANNFIQSMRKNGSLCCLDDFGAGESSFDYLRHLQVDFVKIDGSYVKESMATRRGKHLLRAMVALCRDLGITTIGEMVEDEKAAALLWEAGVRFGQGYLFGKPTVDSQTLTNCSKPTPYYQGIMRAKRVSDGKAKSWWKRKE